ncbi:6-carboxytetrahydropterin synthase [Amphritea sp. 1_MG-2023]|uniref:6-carboxytetrahydropterin synthase n=1 Tax=Amphritea sp. 1_MG-2023 TaxID=3062670 RepID=UPI0026E351E2|nr:6-carboxytetrahydropterin synthase [Amphritea sp. 1_MG-2023]MDO6563918.1 6-carboxytetrahydropterin synthase [Amphritea sp. 1_MG-2023]
MKLFVDNLTNVDFSYLHPQRGLLGESWLVQLVLDGDLNEEGMICDFGIVKKAVKQWFDNSIDHALVVPTNMANLHSEQLNGETTVNWRYPEGGEFYCRSPEQAIVLVDIDEINELSLAAWCNAQLLALFPDEVKGLEISFVPETINAAYYHYSHGLQQHDGNCQRIAHGHRSRIQIFLDGQRDTVVEQQWAKTFSDIYIGTRSHLVSATDDEHHYCYDAPQGEFEIRLPASHCYLMGTETTVEQIACHLAAQVKLSHPDREVMVRAFEGVGKGAIATA